MKYFDWKNNANDYWVVDTEANSLSPDRFWCAVGYNLGSGEWVEFDPEGMYDGRFKRFIESVPVLVGHNYLSWDNYHTSRLLSVYKPVDRIIDSLVLSYLYFPHLPSGHSIEAYGERFGLPKLEHTEWDHFSPEMLARCRRDVELNAKVYKALCSRMTKIGFSEKSAEIEHNIRHVIDKQQRRGFYFDRDKAVELVEEFDQRLERLNQPIQELFPPVLSKVADYKYRIRAAGQPYASYLRHRETYDAIEFSDDNDNYTVFNYKHFDIGSPKQRVEKLLSLGWEPTQFTEAGNPKIDEDTLRAYALETGRPEIEAIADWVVLSSRKSMVEGWLKVLGDDSRIHGTLFTCGAGSRRARHVRPNSANIPSNEVIYGPECRDLWLPSPGLTLLGCDAKAVQMRMFGHYLGDPEVAELYITGDPHQVNADNTGVPRKKVKNVFYSMIFGAADLKIASTAGFSDDRRKGAEIRRILYRTTPGFEEAVSRAKEEYESNDGLLRCIDGGYVRCPSPHAALNYQIQSGEAVLMKEVINRMYDILGDDLGLVGWIHDEIQVELEEERAKEIGELFNKTMTEAGEDLGFKVAMEGSYKVGNSWRVTH